jgi:hypothetical protein
MGVEEKELRGYPNACLGDQNEENRIEMERVVQYLKKTVFPRIKG